MPGVPVPVGLYLVLPGSCVRHPVWSAHVFAKYLHCAVPSLSTKRSGHVTRPPHGGQVSRVCVWVGLSLGAATFVVPGACVRHPGMQHYFCICSSTALLHLSPTNFVRTSMDPDGCPGIQACVQLRLCLGEGSLSGLTVSMGSHTGRSNFDFI